MVRQSIVLGVLAVFAGWFGPVLAPAPARADAPAGALLKAGFAERDISPEVGMEAPAGYTKARHKSFHDACKVRAAVFDDGRARVALVGIDALGIRRDTVLNARREAEKRCGVPGGSIMIGASHSHSSGPTIWTLRGDYDGDSELVRRLAYEESTIADAGYLKKVEQALVEAICEANDRRVAALVGVGRGFEGTVSFNRRFIMRDGTTKTHPGLGNPDIDRPAGPIDPEVGVIGAWDAKDPNHFLGCIVNFACHGTTSPGGISANYIHYLEKVIQGYYGPKAVSVFLNGMSGDVTQVDNQSPYLHPKGERWAQFVGGRVGAEALKVLLSMEPGATAPVAAVRRIWEIRRRKPSAEHVRDALAIVRGGRKKVDPTTWTFAKETVVLDALVKQHPTAEVEVQAVQVGPAVFASVPAEYFCRLGLEIKADSGFPFTFPVSLANGCVGYVPTEAAFGPHGGGYETRLTSYSNLETTAATQMRDAAIDLARQLQPGPVPERPRRPLKFTGAPWPYGNLPPQRD